MSRKNDSYAEGYDAWLSGISDTKNPYPEETDDHLSWNDGWLKAYEEDGTLEKIILFSKVTVEQILETAKTLFEGLSDDERNEPSEYKRGVCELIGRIILDDLHQGEDTNENALLVAKELGIAYN